MASFADLFERSLPHILEKIFLPLDLGTLANCAEVCQSWKSYLASGGFRRAHLVRLWMDPNRSVEKISVPVPQAVFQVSSLTKGRKCIFGCCRGQSWSESGSLMSTLPGKYCVGDTSPDYV